MCITDYESISIYLPVNYIALPPAVAVHKLRVGDIDVISAMGDSLTAANGALAWTILGCLTEYRGRAWR